MLVLACTFLKKKKKIKIMLEFISCEETNQDLPTNVTNLNAPWFVPLLYKEHTFFLNMF